MMRHNRVWPTGEIVADPARGLFMGNRGCLHDDQGRLGGARWRHKAWITCVLTFKGRKRPLMAPGRYTELFFLDEAVACAAGHRPCAECRRPVWQTFQSHWASQFGPMWAADVDRALHTARIEGRMQRRYQAHTGSLPDGTMVLMEERAHLVLGGRALRWSPTGYGPGQPLPYGEVCVLTPEPLVAVMRAGWMPELHPSAREAIPIKPR